MCLFQSTSNVITASGQLQLISCNKQTVMFRHSLSHHANLSPPCSLPPSTHTSTPVAVLRWLHVSLSPNEVSCRRHYKLNHFTGWEEVSDLFFFFKSGNIRNNSAFHSGPFPRVDLLQARWFPPTVQKHQADRQSGGGVGGCIIEAVLGISGLR